MVTLLVEERPGAHESNHSRASREVVAPRVGYLPGLDGLRALAVLAVILYHCGVPWFAGGFLGVEVFFVISGYLITSLLMAERRTTGRVDLKSFWIRRARRLLPALFTVIAAVSIYSALFLRDSLDQLRGDILGSFFYVMNWWTIFGDTSYFAEFGAPPLLKHLWSLAIEEQFYLLWPFIFVGIWAVAKGKKERAAAIVIGGAAVSAILMWVLYNPAAPDRVYMGTDTRASSLLIGAALAFMWSPWRLTAKTGRNGGAVLDVAGIVALLVLLRLFTGIDQASSILYPIGFLLTSLATATAIAVAVHPGSRVVRGVLGIGTLVWIGKRSYGLYLWNWPIVAITDEQNGFPFAGWPRFVLQVALTFLLAELSYRFIEQPVRTGSWKKLIGGFRSRAGHLDADHRRRFTLVVGGALTVFVLLSVFTVTSMVTATSSQARLTDEVLDGLESIDRGPEITVPATTVAPDGETPAGSDPVTTAPATPAIARVFAIGDSVMLGAQDALYSLGDLRVSAAQNRQFCEGKGIIDQYRAAGQLSPIVVLHLGTNGKINADCFEETMKDLADREKVVVVNMRVPRGWESYNNDLIRSELPNYPNAVMVDWWAQGNAHGEYFYDDATHLRRPDGANFYAQAVKQGIDAPLPSATTAAPTTTAK